MRLARRQYERRESWSSASLLEHAVETMRLPVSNTFYFRWEKVILYVESVMVVRASYLAKLYVGVSWGSRSF
jgi:hypothetical protein